MSDINLHYLLASLLAALGVWLMLPRGRAPGFWPGLVLSMIALGLLASQVPAISGLVTRSVFSILGGITLVAALMTVASRNPVYCAIWFALSLLAAGGMLLIGGAQFLGVATVVVYAGAILVTFLFVLMLAQPEGHAYYDRTTWEAHLAALSGAAMVGVLTLTVASVLGSSGVKTQIDQMEQAAIAALPPAAPDAQPTQGTTGEPQVSAAPTAQVAAAPNTVPSVDVAPGTSEPIGLEMGAADPSIDPRLVQLRQQVLADEHMATLGGQLFSKYLVAVEVAGTLLLVALVAAVAIIAQSRGVSTLATDLRIATRPMTKNPKKA